VTGASGFIGQHMTTALRSASHAVIEATRDMGDVADSETWERFPAVDVVIHLAGKPFVPLSWAEPASFIRANVVGTTHALEYARRYGARVVFLSSYIYGAPKDLPIPETAAVDATNPYALSKWLAEQTCAFYAERFGVPVVVLRPFNVYGPGQAVDFLIPTIVRQVCDAQPIRVKDLKPRRDYVYVEDVVDLILLAMECAATYKVFNAGSGVSHSVDDIIGIVQRTVGTTLPIVSDNERRPGEVMDTVADIALAKHELGWEPRWSLDAGIEATIQHTRECLPKPAKLNL
jgi:GDP-4-dehydro-6-deoxy-D-mannose reductase